MTNTAGELGAISRSHNLQQGIEAAKELSRIELEEREKTPVHNSVFFRTGGELKSSSRADTILLKRLAILRHHLNPQELSQAEYSKRKRAISKRYVGAPAQDGSDRLRSMELDLSQGLLFNLKHEHRFLEQIQLSNDKTVVAAAKYAKEKISNPLLLQQVSSAVAIATENISSLKPGLDAKVRAFSETLQNDYYDREKLLEELVETPFCGRSFDDFAHQLLGLSDAMEELESIRKQEYSYIGQGNWPYLSLSGHDVLSAIKQLKPSKNDVLTEVGCGLGINAVFIGLTTELRVDGFDINPDWVKLANQISSNIGRDDISFFVEDACSADYEDTTIFLIYSPFSDQALIESMLKRIEPCAWERPITILAAYDDLINVLDEVSWVESAGTIGAIEIFKNC